MTRELSRRRLPLLVAAGVFAVGLVAAPAGAAPSAKRLRPCSLVAPEELEPIFEQPFRKGVADEAGVCAYQLPALARGDDIVVSVLPQRFSSTPRAKQGFAKAERVTGELAPQVEPVQVGQEAFYSVLIGTDLLTMRVGRVVVTVRVENNDDAAAVYRDQAIAVGQAIALRLVTAP